MLTLLDSCVVVDQQRLRVLVDVVTQGGSDPGIRCEEDEVRAVARDSDAERAGIRVGDRLLAVDGVSLRTRGIDEALRASHTSAAPRITFLLLRPVRREVAEHLSRLFSSRLTPSEQRDCVTGQLLDVRFKPRPSSTRKRRHNGDGRTLSARGLLGVTMLEGNVVGGSNDGSTDSSGEGATAGQAAGPHHELRFGDVLLEVGGVSCLSRRELLAAVAREGMTTLTEIGRAHV